MNGKIAVRKVMRLFSLALVMSLLFAGSIRAWAESTEINFIGEHVKIYFHPPLHTGSQDPHPLRTEIPKLNLILNHLENYLVYLTKLGKIPEDLQLNIDYYPGGNDEFFGTNSRLMIQDLGWNSLLGLVNGRLKRLSGGVKRYLIDNSGSLFQIRDQLPRLSDSFESRMNFTNLSAFLERLEPESDFIPIGSGAAITIRPGETLNHLTYLSMAGSGSVLLPTGKSVYSQLRLSADRSWLAFSEGDEPKLFSMVTHEITVLFPTGNKTLLEMEWAPNGNLISGIVLDRNSSSREVFIYDADKKEHLTFFAGHSDFDGDYQYAYPYWAPNGQRLLYSTGNDITLIDVAKGKVFPALIHSTQIITEIVWSPDSQSIAYVEMDGQARDKSEFTDTDLRGWTLHRCWIQPNGKLVDDPYQNYTSRETIKLVGFWSLNRILFLEGHLRTPKIQTPVIDLTGIMAARLTPTPGMVKVGQTVATDTDVNTGFMDLPMKYCLVFKNIDGKFKNVYDAGYGHTNQLFVEQFKSTWFLGLRLPDGISGKLTTFSLMPSPYPFPERNTTICNDYPAAHINSLMGIIKGYNVRRLEVADDLNRFFFLSNGRGPMTLWSGNIQDLEKIEVPREAIAETSEGQEAGPEVPKVFPTELPGDALPFPGGPPGGTFLSIPGASGGSSPGLTSAAPSPIPTSAQTSTESSPSDSSSDGSSGGSLPGPAFPLPPPPEPTSPKPTSPEPTSHGPKLSGPSSPAPAAAESTSSESDNPLPGPAFPLPPQPGSSFPSPSVP